MDTGEHLRREAIEIRLREDYGLELVDRPRRLGPRAAEVLTNDGRYLFKVHPEYARTNAELAGEVQYALAQRGLAPGLRRTLAGRPVSVGSRVVSLQEWLPGAGRTPSPAETGDRLAQMHEVLAGFPAGTENHIVREVGRLSGLEPSPVLETYADLIRRVERRCSQDGVRLLHGDMHPGNVIDNGHEVLFVDFDCLTTGPVWKEASFAAFRGGLGTGDELDRDRFDAFMEAYARASSQAVLPVDEALDFAAYVVLERIAFLHALKRRGDERFWDDLENQQRYLDASFRARSPE